MINKQIMQFGQRQPELLTTFNVVDVIEESLDMFETLTLFKGVRVEKHFDHAEMRVYGSRSMFEQAFKNLILNAIDSMDGRSLKVLKVSVKRPKHKPGTMICIEDTGCGIAEEHREKIFEPYFTCKPGGNGLGLAIVKEAVTKHRGNIFAKNKSSGGTCFVIELPPLDERKSIK